MHRRTMRRLLWIALLVTFPVPYWVMEGGRVPTVWLLEVAGFCLAVVAAEGGSIPALLTGLFVAQTALAMGGLYLVARLVSAFLDRRLHGPWRRRGILAAVLLLVTLSCFSIYSTPLVAQGRSTNLLDLFV